MTDEAQAKIRKLESEYRALLHEHKLGISATPQAELEKKIDRLSGEIARAYYAGFHS